MNDPNTTHTDKALRGLRQMGSAHLLTQIITWILTAITVHILTPRDYGLIATAGMFTVFAQMLFDGGLTEVLVSQRELPTAMQGAGLTAVFLVAFALGTTIFSVAPLAARFFHSAPLTAVLRVSAFYLPLTALGFAPSVLLTKQLRFNDLGRIQLATGVFQGASTLALAYAGEAYWALIIGNFLGMTLRVTLFWLALDQRPSPNMNFRDLIPVLRNGVHMIGQRFSYFTLDNLDIFLLSRFSGSAALGPYSVARTLAHTALDKISRVTSTVAVPAFAVKTDATDQLRGLITVVSVSATVAFPLFWIMGVVSQVALPLVFGNRWVNMVVPFAAFAAYLPLRTIYSFINPSLIGTGRTGLTLRNTLSWLAILLPFILLGVTRGADGVALGSATAFPIVFYIAMKRTSRAFNVGPFALLKPILAPATCAAISACVAELSLISLQHRISVPLIVACQCLFSTISYVALLRHLSKTQYEQTISLVRRIARG